jgi:signal transduction histidine kinase
VNLIQNAVQATEKDAAVRIIASPLPDGGLELAVEDDGPGVDPGLRPRLFQPFVTGKGSEGLGMGLYMARLIVESHGGRIRLVDRPRGSRFELQIPAVEKTAAP